MLYKLYENQAATTNSASTTGEFEAQDVSFQPVTYLCHEGRALECQPDPAPTNAEEPYMNAAADNYYCIEQGYDPGNMSTMTGWAIVEGVLGEEQVTFEAENPDCLPNTPVAVVPTDGALGELYSYLKTVAAGAKNIQYIEKFGTEYIEAYAVDLPIKVNDRGNLCTNRWEVPEGIARILVAMYDGVFRTPAEAQPVTPNTPASEIPENV